VAVAHINYVAQKLAQSAFPGALQAILPANFGSIVMIRDLGKLIKVQCTKLRLFVVIVTTSPYAYYPILYDKIQTRATIAINVPICYAMMPNAQVVSRKASQAMRKLNYGAPRTVKLQHVW
jgi:hypothetical protein